jgi:MATE family multidrug resistance protein
MGGFSISEINKKLIPLALSMAGSQLVTVSSGFLCMTMLATLGHEVLAASALIFSTQISVIVIGMSFLFSLSVLISHAYGKKQYFSVGQFVQHGWTLSVLLSIPMIIFFWNIDAVLLFFGQPKVIVKIVQQFFYAYTLRVIPLLLGVCNQQLCYGVRKQRIDILANICSSSENLASLS